jgi:ABC-type dipeptide/oligopeptide/nickel transport system permease component
MTKFILRRVLKGIFTVWFIWSLIFVLVRLAGDPIEWMIPDVALDSVKDELRTSLGLDLPIWKQYLASFKNLFLGDMGSSYYYKRDVVELFMERVPYTVSIAVPSIVLAGVFGLLFGMIAAIKHDTVIDRTVMTIAIVLYTIPGFALGIILILIFSVKLHILPSGNIGNWKNMVMPIICLLVGTMASTARLTRSSMLDVLNKEYLDGARMKGVKESIVILKHALRNSLIPVVTSLGLQLGTVIGGAVVIETVFGWPGVGELLVTAANKRDFPVVQFGVLMLSVAVTVTNIVIDISYGWLDPRIRESFK